MKNRMKPETSLFIPFPKGASPASIRPNLVHMEKLSTHDPCNLSYHYYKERMAKTQVATFI